MYKESTEQLPQIYNVVAYILRRGLIKVNHRGCDGKVGYNKGKAKRIAMQMQGKYKVKFNFYKCGNCSYYHVGKDNLKV